MKHIRGAVVIIASLALVGGCSLGSSSGGEDSESPTSPSSEATPQETHTETVTATETSGTVEAGGSATASAAQPSASSTTDASPDPGGDDGPEQAVEDFATAIADADYQAVCDAFDPEVIKAMEQGGQDCAEAMEDNWDEMDIPAGASIDVRDSEVSADGRSATVTVRNQDGRDEEVDLEKVGGEWKITFDG